MTDPNGARGGVFFAYDGSINGDWVARYAIRLASHTSQRLVRLIHVEDGACPAETRAAKLERLAYECEVNAVSLEVITAPLRGTVAASLAAIVPSEPDTFLLCGTRVRPGARGYLRGTVSRQLMRTLACHVIAMRVVQPGLLGTPHRVLLPIERQPRDPLPVGALLRLLRPDVEALHILRIMSIRRHSLVRLGARRINRLRRIGRGQVEHIERELGDSGSVDPDVIDTFVRVSDDWGRQVIVHASHHRSQLVCAGIPARHTAFSAWSAGRLEYLLAHTPCDLALYRGGRGR